jgi:hypothetical protein
MMLLRGIVGNSTKDSRENLKNFGYKVEKEQFIRHGDMSAEFQIWTIRQDQDK